MLKLRTQLGLLIIWFIFFFNIERLAEVINIASYVYILSPIISALIIFAPKLVSGLGHPWLLSLSTALFFILKYAGGYPVGGSHLPITITEMFSLYLTYYLSTGVGASIQDFEKMVTDLTFQQIGLPPRLYESTDTEDLYREVKRCRRFGHPLSVMIIKPEYDAQQVESSRILKEIQSAFATRYVQVRLAKLYSDRLRDTDLIVIHDNEIILLLPETSEKNAKTLLEGIKNEAMSGLNIDVSCGLSNFPNHSVTLNGLLNIAGKNLQDTLGQKGPTDDENG